MLLGRVIGTVVPAVIAEGLAGTPCSGYSRSIARARVKESR